MVISFIDQVPYENLFGFFKLKKLCFPCLHLLGAVSTLRVGEHSPYDSKYGYGIFNLKYGAIND